MLAEFTVDPTCRHGAVQTVDIWWLTVTVGNGGSSCTAASAGRVSWASAGDGRGWPYQTANQPNRSQ
jgi:hypothetical protein